MLLYALKHHSCLLCASRVDHCYWLQCQFNVWGALMMIHMDRNMLANLWSALQNKECAFVGYKSYHHKNARSNTYQKKMYKYFQLFQNAILETATSPGMFCLSDLIRQRMCIWNICFRVTSFLSYYVNNTNFPNLHASFSFSLFSTRFGIDCCLPSVTSFKVVYTMHFIGRISLFTNKIHYLSKIQS
jgi:hypothetical protein